jgi:FAD/FMN-containing dehydrogenases
VIPVAITYPRTTEQVAGIVSCAVENGYKVQPRSGGHSYANYGLSPVSIRKSTLLISPFLTGLGGTDGAVVVDLKRFQQFSVDPDTLVATIGAGTLLGDLQSRLDHAGGRAVAHGTCPQVGTGGHFTIGGLGTMSREWGMALDHIVGAEVVLANSTIIRASDTHNQDVFFCHQRCCGQLWHSH